MQRLAAAECAVYGKLTDVELLRAFRRGTTMHRFGVEEQEYALELDVTFYSLEDAAKRIREHIINVSPELG